MPDRLLEIRVKANNAKNCKPPWGAIQAKLPDDHGVKSITKQFLTCIKP